MKKIYNYRTGELIKESLSDNTSKRSLNESVSFDDIIESQRELYNDNELKKVIFSPSEKPVVIWEFAGNRCINIIEDLCDENGIDYCSVSVRDLRGDFSRLASIYNGESLVIIDELTFGNPADFSVLFDILTDLMTNDDATVVCVGKIDARNNDILAPKLAANFVNFIYSPQEDRQSTVGDDDDYAYESVSDKFAKYRKLYESDDEDSDEGSSEESTDDSDDDKSSDEKDSDDSSDEEGSDDSSDETEDVPMTAIVLTVKKDDIDKCKEELVDANIPEDAIDVIDTEDDDENGKLKVDADYALELKDYLKGKGIDLEEKIGGEIVDDSEEKKDDSDSSDSSDDTSDDSSDDMGDFDDEFGDLFADDSDEQ